MPASAAAVIGIISAVVGAGAAVYSATQKPPDPETIAPGLTSSDSDMPVSAGEVKDEVKEATSSSRREFLTKQALAKAKYSTIKTGGLGLAGGVLNTARKSLLGG